MTRQQLYEIWCALHTKKLPAWNQYMQDLHRSKTITIEMMRWLNTQYINRRFGV